MRLSGNLLEMEGAILEASNAVGRCASEEALGRFDTDGSPMRLGETKLTARGRNPKVYQSPYGEVQVERYVYQTSRGGRIYCPLEHQARIIRGATPRFASQLSHKYAQLNVRAVQRDLEQNHGRKVATSYIQNVAEYVGSIATAKEETWEYALPPLDVPMAAIVISLDGAMIPMADSAGYREAMAGALSFYDHDGERQHTIYLAAAPEYGKQTFLARLEREIARQAVLSKRAVSGHCRWRLRQLDISRAAHAATADRLFPCHRVHRQARTGAVSAAARRAATGRLAAHSLPHPQARPRGTPSADR